jgi:iron-sulfur cluster assembly accessory protein
MLGLFTRPAEVSMSLVTVTEAAASQIKRLLDQDGKATTHALRMKVVGGGCSGLQYQLMFDDQRKERPRVEGAACLSWTRRAPCTWWAPCSTTWTLMESGFKIQNPNAKESCGCGQSFSA